MFYGEVYRSAALVLNPEQWLQTKWRMKLLEIKEDQFN